jgi:hypothetical protein
MGRIFHFAKRVLFCVGGLPWLGISILGMLALSPALLSQTSTDSEARGPMPTDWSHHHLIFSTPVTGEQASRLQQDPRYWQQLARRSRATLPEAELDGASESRPDLRFWLPKKHKLKRDWSEDMGSGAKVGAGQYPAVFSAGSTPNCTGDFAVFNTSLAASATQASIIAYNNLYSGCTGTVPSVHWAYDTLGTVTTSVTLSADGSQVAFVQLEGTVATLVLLKWSASTTESATAPLVLTNTANGSYRTCTAPCMTTIAFKATTGTDATPTDTYSAPFYVFENSSGPLYDTLYVGDDAGYLHQFTGVFFGTPSETTTTWPVEVATANLSSPVYDSGTGNVFVTTSYVSSGDTGGRIAAVCATTACTGVSNGNSTVAIGTPTPSLVLGPTKTTGVACHGSGASGNGFNLRVDAPLVDSTAGKAYVAVGNDGNGNSAVIQFSTTVGTGTGDLEFHVSCGTESTIGAASTTAGIPVFAGTFDNIYFTSSNGGSPTGNLYACGNTSADPTLYQIPITSNAIATTGNSVVAVSSANTTCSPVTEVFSANNTDLLFLSADASGASTACTGTGGCIFNVQVTAWLPSTVYAVGQEVMDTHFQIQVVKTVTGVAKSGTATPTWSTTVGGTTADNNVTWLNQGLLSTTITAPAFALSTAYTVGKLVLDSKGNIELCTIAGTSGSAQPAWQTTPGAITTSGTARFENLGANGTNALSAAGGTSGIVIDNTASSGTEAGASEVYYSPLANQTCATSGGTGGCAVQASQSALH